MQVWIKSIAKQLKYPCGGFTHGSKFHSDDVFATAFLKILNPGIETRYKGI